MAQYMLPSGGVLNEDTTSRTVMLPDGMVVSWTGAGGTTDGSASDSFSMTDSAAGSISATGAASDSFAMTDSSSGEYGTQGDASDSFGMTDSAGAGISTSASVSDSFGMSDSVSGEITTAAVASDSFAMTDASSGEYGNQGAASDSFGMTDSAGAGASTVASVSDTFVISDLISSGLSVSAIASDSFTVTDSASHVLVIVSPLPIHMQVMEYVRDEVIALGLPYLPSDLVKIRKFPWTTDHIYPGLTIHPLRESLGRGTNSKFDIGYGCGLTFVLSTGDGIEEDIELLTGFRQAMHRRFMHTKPPIDSIWQATVEHGDIYMPRRYQDHYDVTTLHIRFWSEEPVFA